MLSEHIRIQVCLHSTEMFRSQLSLTVRDFCENFDARIGGMTSELRAFVKH